MFQRPAGGEGFLSARGHTLISVRICGLSYKRANLVLFRGSGLVPHDANVVCVVTVPDLLVVMW